MSDPARVSSVPALPPFAGATIDRAAGLRADPQRVAELARGSDGLVLAATGDAVLMDRVAPNALLRHRAVGGLATVLAEGEPILLGLEQGRPLFAVDLEGVTEEIHAELTGAGEPLALREAGVRLPQSEGGLAAYMVSLLNWHRRHRFCANCGATTEIVEAGLARRCPSCGASHFPRTDPVVIMLVEHDGRLLLGRRSGWPARRYSVLAGFVSPGETPEAAVVREVQEESGITAYGARYVAAQPWPFPASLMLGYEACSDGGDPRPGDGELADVGWFTLQEIRAAERGSTDMQLPPPVSIARLLIDGWLARQG